MAKVTKYIKANSGSPEKFMSAVQNRIDELQSGDMMMSEDIMDGNILEEEVIGDDEVDGEELVFPDYQSFMDYYIENVDPDYAPEQVEQDIVDLQEILLDMDVAEEECPIYYSEESENPVIEINGERYLIDYFEEGLAVKPENEEVDEEIVEEEPVTSSYKIEDSYGAPQAGVDVKEFADYDELEDYLLNNTDVEERISEGYARIVESASEVENTPVVADTYVDEFDEYREALEAMGVSSEAIGLVEGINGTSYQTFNDICEYVLGHDLQELLETRL